MVLCDGGFLLSSGFALLMNGASCAYTMNEEKDLREAMRQDIREEWRQQREIESREQRQEQKSERLRLQSMENRYEKLMMASSTPPRDYIHECRAFSAGGHISGGSRTPSPVFLRGQRRHWEPKDARKQPCSPVSLFDNDEDENEDDSNPQGSM